MNGGYLGCSVLVFRVWYGVLVFRMRRGGVRSTLLLTARSVSCSGFVRGYELWCVRVYELCSVGSMGICSVRCTVWVAGC